MTRITLNFITRIAAALAFGAALSGPAMAADTAIGDCVATAEAVAARTHATITTTNGQELLHVMAAGGSTAAPSSVAALHEEAARWRAEGRADIFFQHPDAAEMQLLCGPDVGAPIGKNPGISFTYEGTTPPARFLALVSAAGEIVTGRPISIAALSACLVRPPVEQGFVSRMAGGVVFACENRDGDELLGCGDDVEHFECKDRVGLGRDVTITAYAPSQ